MALARVPPKGSNSFVLTYKFIQVHVLYFASFCRQVMKTEFVPKLVATVTTCCAIYLILKVSANLLTVKTLASVGYFDTLVRF